MFTLSLKTGAVDADLLNSTPSIEDTVESSETPNSPCAGIDAPSPTSVLSIDGHKRCSATPEHSQEFKLHEEVFNTPPRTSLLRRNPKIWSLK
jgi:hypothetical protein